MYGLLILKIFEFPKIYLLLLILFTIKVNIYCWQFSFAVLQSAAVKYLKQINFYP